MTHRRGAMGALEHRREPACARETCIRPTTLASSYYEIWIKALEVLLERHGFVTQDELAAGRR